MITENTIDELMEQLGGFVCLREYALSNFTDFSGDENEKEDSFHTLLSKVRSCLDGYVPANHWYIQLVVGAPRDTGGRGNHDGLNNPGGYMDMIRESLSNALSRGNKYDPSALTSLKVLECNDGYIVRIRDSGQGFDPYEICGKREQKEQEAFRGIGAGFDFFTHPDTLVSFENNGTTLNLVITKTPLYVLRDDCNASL